MSDQTKPPAKTQQVAQDAEADGKSNVTTHVISPRLLEAMEYQTPMGEFYAKATQLV